jgi:hypothetical protein
MNTELENKQQDKPVQVPVIPNNDSFNFESWAREVRPLLLAALQKERRSSKRNY